ncbi:hypothetical protein [Anoxybacillus thermarum]|uniref:hypothetical protein n=1 Tax=Anoxybacillus thermarum TaxID=404937 RepID=UPI0005C63D22|nr:hypothetical protein [Anoxybacillus thermarum]
MQRIDGEDRLPITHPRAPDTLLRVKRYADLLGNKKKLGIKSPSDNKVKLAETMSKSTRFEGSALSNAMEEALKPLQNMQKLLGGAAQQSMAWNNESVLGRI